MAELITEISTSDQYVGIARTPIEGSRLADYFVYCEPPIGFSQVQLSDLGCDGIKPTEYGGRRTDFNVTLLEVRETLGLVDEAAYVIDAVRKVLANTQSMAADPKAWLEQLQ